jgi:hypothetical protein
MTRRQQYWQDLFIIRSATGTLNRRLTFLEASQWVYAYTAEVRRGYEQKDAAERATDCLWYVRVAKQKGIVWTI